MIVIDRIEGSLAVVFFGDQLVELPLSLLPEGVREGAVLQLQLAPAAAEASLAEAEARLARLRARSGPTKTTFDL